VSALLQAGWNNASDGGAEVKESKSFEGELELDGGTMVTIECTVYFNMVVDNNYGADADGNRGVRMEWAEDIEYDYSVNVSRFYGKERWVYMDKLRRVNQGRIENALEKKLF